MRVFYILPLMMLHLVKTCTLIIVLTCVHNVHNMLCNVLVFTVKLQENCMLYYTSHPNSPSITQNLNTFMELFM